MVGPPSLLGRFITTIAWAWTALALRKSSGRSPHILDRFVGGCGRHGNDWSGGGSTRPRALCRRHQNQPGYRNPNFLLLTWLALLNCGNNKSRLMRLLASLAQAPIAS